MLRYVKVTRRRLIALLVAAPIAYLAARALLGGCEAPKPSGVRCPVDPPIAYGRDACPLCQMPVTDPWYSAAALVCVRGRPRWFFFDDIGCMAHWTAEYAPGDVLLRCVVDRVDGEWIVAEKAMYLVTTEYTQMGTGILAVKPSNVGKYLRGVVEARGFPRPSGRVLKVVDYRCVSRFRYGEGFEVPRNWYADCRDARHV